MTRPVHIGADRHIWQPAGARMTYTEIDLKPTNLTVRPVGRNRWLALRMSLYAAKADVVSVELGGRLAENGPVGLRFPGTNVPGRFLAGTFWKFWGDPNRRVKSFWIRRHPDKCIRIDLANHEYDYLMVEVDDPESEIARINEWLAS
jgi:hypothetical protein